MRRHGLDIAIKLAAIVIEEVRNVYRKISERSHHSVKKHCACFGESCIS